MKHHARIGFATFLAAVTLATAPLAFSADKIPPAQKVITVHVGGHSGDGIAKAVNEMHAKMEAEGWRFQHFAHHTENGDSEGAWVTYVRD